MSSLSSKPHLDLDRSPLHQALVGHSFRRPHSPAVVRLDGAAISFAEAAEASAHLAAQLEAAGLTGADLAVVLLPAGPAHLLAILGVTGLCAAALLNASAAPGDLARDLTELRASAIVASASDAPLHALAADLGLALVVCDPAWPPAPDRPGLPSPHAWTLLRRRTTTVEAELPPDTMLVAFTSATTGRRKIVRHTVSSLQASIVASRDLLDLTPDDRLLLMARPFHMQGIVSPLAAIDAGGCAIAAGDYSPGRFYDSLERLVPTWYTAGPTIHRSILTELQQRGVPRHSLRFARSSSMTLDLGLKQELSRLLGVPVLDGYGLTEVGLVSSNTLQGDTPEASVGRPQGQMQAALLTAEGRILEGPSALLAEGEVVLRGPAVFPGYLRDPAANEESFHHGWFRTGDLARIDAQGHLFLVGRLKEIINRGGQKIVPNEIDRALAAHPAVFEALATGLPHPTLGEDIACAVVLRPGAHATAQELRRFAAAHLPHYQQPRRILIVPALPRGSTGKPSRRMLREIFQHADPAEAKAPQGPLDRGRDVPDYFLDEAEDHILGQWSEALRRIRGEELEIGLDDDFFQLGGDSLTAVGMLVELEQHFGLQQPISPDSFLESPTPRSLARLIQGLHGVQTAAAPPSAIVYPVRVPGDPADSAPSAAPETARLFLVPAGADQGLYFRRLARHLAALPGSPLRVSLVRPHEHQALHGPFHPLYEIEEAGVVAADSIRAAQPQGPYLLGGYCQGGAVAWETAAQLARTGVDVRVVLFDTPTVGLPHPVRQARFYGNRAASRLHTASKHRSLKPLWKLTRFGRKIARFTLLRQLRPVLRLLWRLGPVRRLAPPGHGLAWYRPRRSNVRLLNLIAAEDANPLRLEVRTLWSRLAQRGAETQRASGGHYTLFTESSLPTLATQLRDWLLAP